MPVYEFPRLIPREVVDFEGLRGQDVYLRNFHFIFSSEDIAEIPIDFPRIQNAITLDIKRHWTQLRPNQEVIDRSSNGHYSIGLHVRRNGEVDTTDWGKPDDAFISEVLKFAIGKRGSLTVFICSPSERTLRFMYEALRPLGVEVTITASNRWGQDRESVILSCVDMIKLSKCDCVIRRDISTFSALPSLVGANSEIIYTQTGQVIERVPLVFSGAAL